MIETQGFKFNASAGNYLGTVIVASLVTFFTLGICYPFALVMIERWKADNATVDGRRVQFVGTGVGLFGLWIKWFFLTLITIGIYSFWVAPQLQKWKWENIRFI